MLFDQAPRSRSHAHTNLGYLGMEGHRENRDRALGTGVVGPVLHHPIDSPRRSGDDNSLMEASHKPSTALGSDGERRCWWALSSPEYVAYHDTEWGRPVLDDDALFERLCLEGFQSGLSWLTILRKREAFRSAFAGFRIPVVASFGSQDIERLLADKRIVRNRLKILAAIDNARAATELIEDVGSLAHFVWSFRPTRRRAPRSRSDVPSWTPESAALARDLKQRGFRFVGPITAYALMQACGLVNDHFVGCCGRSSVAGEQNRLLLPRAATASPS